LSSQRELPHPTARRQDALRTPTRLRRSFVDSGCSGW